jgi:hypothetical protein
MAQPNTPFFPQTLYDRFRDDLVRSKNSADLYRRKKRATE